MKRPVSLFALFAFCSTFAVPFSRAAVCVSARVKHAKACGIVTDPYGMPIPRATINFGTDGSHTVVTDNHGRFSIAAQGDDVKIHVDAIGFRSVEANINSLSEPPANCKKPLFVMLTLDNESCGMIAGKKSDLWIVKKD